MEPHGLSLWRHGCSRITPVSPRRRPGGDTVAPGVFPVYHSIWQPSRLLSVSPGCFKHFKTTGDMSRFNTVHPGSPRLSTVPPRLWHGSSRIIKPGWTGTLNRDSENGAKQTDRRTDGGDYTIPFALKLGDNKSDNYHIVKWFDIHHSWFLL